MTFRNIDPIIGTNTGITRIVPVHAFSEDLVWSHGAHDIKFGGTARLISNKSIGLRQGLQFRHANASVIKGSGNDLGARLNQPSKGDTTSYEYGMVGGAGNRDFGDRKLQQHHDGTIIPQGSPVTRNFVSREAELYAQDSWRIKRNFTLTYGLRLSIMPPVHEANGQQLSSNIPIGQWMDSPRRACRPGPVQPGRGHSSPTLPMAGPIIRSTTTGSRAWASRISPNGESGISKFLFGQGKTSIRAGAGMYYDLIGQPLAGFIAANSYGSGHLARHAAERLHFLAVAALRGLQHDSLGAQCSAVLPARAEGDVPGFVPECLRDRQFARRPPEGAVHHEPELQHGPRIRPAAGSCRAPMSDDCPATTWCSAISRCRPT